MHASVPQKLVNLLRALIGALDGFAQALSYSHTFTL